MITILLYLIFFFEVHVDYNVWRAQIKDESIAEYDKLWHRWKFVMWTAVMLFIYCCTGSVFVVVAACVTRLLAMQLDYNAVRGMPPQHLGTNTIDAVCKKLLGEWTTLITKTILFIITLYYEGAHYETITKEVFRAVLSH